jgi:hypothetical protein
MITYHIAESTCLWVLPLFTSIEDAAILDVGERFDAISAQTSARRANHRPEILLEKPKDDGRWVELQLVNFLKDVLEIQMSRSGSKASPGGILPSSALTE